VVGVLIIFGIIDLVGLVEEVVVFGVEIGYLFLIKVVVGGGGKGMKVVGLVEEVA